MKKLLFGIHNHQPVGNFLHVLEHAYETSYRPFVEILYEYPEFKFAMHTTGPLWEFFENEHPEFIERLREMVDRGQVELVVSGFYEPVLASIPHRDRVGQVKLAINYVKDRFKFSPHGLWLTERVWESEILTSLVECGIKYVMVDDFHFISAGKRKEELHGYYITESEGNTLNIFPIDETLRYLIPFREVEQSINYIKSIPGELAIIFDDGEKFGVWPGTHSWVYEKGWLRRFVEEVLSCGEIETITFTQATKEYPPLGRVYLPTASYFEMGEWALPPEGAVEFLDFVNRLKEEGIFDKYRRFVRGGIWRNFLVKYEESNIMHKKMLFLSNVLKDRRSRVLKGFLYRAQCNDAYWHGVFGGLYLPHLRKEIYKNLIEVDSRIKSPGLLVDDLDKDGKTELTFKSKDIRVSVKPHSGGTVYEISHFLSKYNFQDTLARRFEHYHRGVKIGEPPAEGVASIHEFEKWIDEKSAREMVYDSYPRYSAWNHFLAPEVKPEDLRYNRYEELSDFLQGDFRYKAVADGVKLWCSGNVRGYGETSFVRLFKHISLKGNNIGIDWGFRSGKPLNHVAALELNLKFEAPRLNLNGNILDMSFNDLYLESAESLKIFDEVLKVTFSLDVDGPCNLYIYPILTISQSERGFDLVYQGNSIFLMNRVSDTNFRQKVKLMFKGGKNA